MLWSLHQAQWEFLPPGRVLSEPRGGSWRKGAKYPRTHLSIISLGLDTFKELVNGGSSFGPLLLRQGPSAAHTLNWLKCDVTRRAQEIKREMPNADLREDRGPLPQNPPTPSLPFGFLSPSFSDLQKEPVQKKENRAVMNKTAHESILKLGEGRIGGSYSIFSYMSYIFFLYSIFVCI